ncbi:hypothetical protein GGE35_003032 [Rhizobium cellulosilyticum]|uniref:Uncharacterized protein n=1 Tax=Aliirhizobium cellulosilyticum TaxID=393664 RepID=A0A7W6UZG6_9HYPH|nr:hypothetical protein [Rhizobium cellulosilyticum]MBB4412577.1 hypothetical protein [Rhizobium cellulosilyticum]MBB4447209.1 hypothetical protein [Rhizobium cellulosilyticum]
MRYFSSWGIAHDNVLDGYTVVPNETSPSAIALYVKEATDALCSAFNGFDYPLNGIEQAVEKMTSRTW